MSDVHTIDDRKTENPRLKRNEYIVGSDTSKHAVLLGTVAVHLSSE